MRALVLGVLLVSAVVHGHTTPAAQNTAASRIVAIGDIHGAYDEFVSILTRAGLMDDAMKWAGGRATLVQTGDYTDRGPDVRKVLDLLMRLERDAKAAGGQVVTLLGNHEVMNLVGDWRDVTPAICATFITQESEAKREDSYRQYTQLKSSAADAPSVYSLTREEWMHAHPPGCLEYRAAMSPSGVYGRWLRDKSIAAELEGTLFMHAGINPARTAPRSIRDVNNRTRTEIRRLDAHRQRLASRRLAQSTFTFQQILAVSNAELRHAALALARAKAEREPPPPLDVQIIRESEDLLNVATWSVIDPEGPLWFRGYAQWSEAETSPQVFGLLNTMKLTRVVVGHTVTPTRRITPRFDGRVLLIDTGMLTRVYDGTPAALEITPTALKAIYPTEEVILTPMPATPVPAAPSHSPRQN